MYLFNRIREGPTSMKMMHIVACHAERSRKEVNDEVDEGEVEDANDIKEGGSFLFDVMPSLLASKFLLFNGVPSTASLDEVFILNEGDDMEDNEEGVDDEVEEVFTKDTDFSLMT